MLVHLTSWTSILQVQLPGVSPYTHRGKNVCSNVWWPAHRDGSVDDIMVNLEGSVWTNALTQVGIESFGTADSFLKASHLTRFTR